MDNNAAATATLLSAGVAEEVRALMARRRISGRKLAEMLDVSPSWVSYRMTGVTPIGLDDLQRIAAVFNVEPADLLPRSTGVVADLPPRAPEGRVLKTVGRRSESQGAGIKDIQTTPAGRPRLTGQGPGDHTSPSLVRTARKRPATTHNAPTRPMHGRRASAAG